MISLGCFSSSLNVRLQVLLMYYARNLDVWYILIIVCSPGNLSQFWKFGSGSRMLRQKWQSHSHSHHVTGITLQHPQLLMVPSSLYIFGCAWTAEHKSIRNIIGLNVSVYLVNLMLQSSTLAAMCNILLHIPYGTGNKGKRKAHTDKCVTRQVVVQRNTKHSWQPVCHTLRSCVHA